MAEHAPTPEPEPTRKYVAPTVDAPDFHPTVVRDTGSPADLRRWARGQRIDDFEIVDVLGEGAFGQVYLARQLSLDRLVALKVTANRGDEARTLARLEHDHVVSVYSETVAATHDLLLLCMQYV